VKIQESGTQDYENEFGSSPAVKKDAEEKNGDVLKLLGNQVVGDQECGQESEEEDNTAENHGYLIIGAEYK
jgi:hypothetical protein